MTKNWKKITAEKKLIFFFIEIYVSLGLQKESYRRSLQHLKREHPALQNMKFFAFLWVIFALLDPDPKHYDGLTSYSVPIIS